MNSDFPPDPVIEAYKREIDESLLRENLKRTPKERIVAIMKMNELIDAMRQSLGASSSLSPPHPYLRGAPPDLPFLWDDQTSSRGLNFTLTRQRTMMFGRGGTAIPFPM